MKRYPLEIFVEKLFFEIRLHYRSNPNAKIINVNSDAIFFCIRFA